MTGRCQMIRTTMLNLRLSSVRTTFLPSMALASLRIRTNSQPVVDMTDLTTRRLRY